MVLRMKILARFFIKCDRFYASYLHNGTLDLI